MALNVLFVRRSNFYGADEQAAVDLLTGRGDTVTPLDDGTETNPWPDTSSYDVIVISKGSAVVDISGALTDTRGVVAMGAQWPGWNLCTTTSDGLDQTAITVVDDAHPMAVAAGVSNGSATIYSAADTTTRATGGVPAGADEIADYASNGDPVLFAFEAGATLTTGTAAGRRVAFGPREADVYNATAEALFLASVDWAAGAASGSSISSEITFSTFALLGEVSNVGVTVNPSGELVLSTFDLLADDFTVYISGFSEVVFSPFSTAGGVTSAITAVLSGTVTLGTELTLAAASLLQRIATGTISFGFSLLGTITGGDPVSTGIELIRKGSAYVRDVMREIVQRIVKRY